MDPIDSRSAFYCVTGKDDINQSPLFGTVRAAFGPPPEPCPLNTYLSYPTQ
jgi:hypothetical protein